MKVSKYTIGVVSHNQKLRMALVVLVPLMLIIGLGIGLLFGLNHKGNKPNNPKLPIFQIQSFSATTLSNSTPATWNLTLSVTNPNPSKHLTLYISALALTSFYYPSNRKNDTDRVSVVVKPVMLIPPLLEVKAKNTIFLSPVVFTLSAQTHIVDLIIKDQASGRVDASFGGAVAFGYEKQKNVKGKGISSPGVLTIAGFQNHGAGVLVSQLPTTLVFFDLLF